MCQNGRNWIELIGEKGYILTTITQYRIKLWQVEHQNQECTEN